MNRRKRKKAQHRLMRAVYGESPAEASAALRGGADPGRPDRSGTTPLYLAGVQGQTAIVRLLLAAGAGPDVESGTGSEGLPLCAAAAWGHESTVRELLSAGADAGLREDHGSGHTALEWALRSGHRPTIALLQSAQPAAVGG